MTDLIRLLKGTHAGCTGTIVEYGADTVTVRLRYARTLRGGDRIRIPRSDDWYEPVDPQPLSASEARARRTS